jgi:hypothetical protein
MESNHGSSPRAQPSGQTGRSGKNYGDDKELRISANNEALLRFEVSSIPANAVIDRATLTLAIKGGAEEEPDDCDDGDHEGHAIAPIKLHRTRSTSEARPSGPSSRAGCSG